MNWWDAAILGIIQGLTEFLPISSSGHLVLFQNLIPGFKQPGVLFDVWLHAATLLAAIIYFYGDILEIAKGFFPGRRKMEATDRASSRDRRFIVLLVIASIPAGVIGITLNSEIEKIFQSGATLGPEFMVTGMLLLIAGRWGSESKKIEDLTFGEALAIGLAQAFALLPAISRSGATISIGILLGLKWEDAIKFSFFLFLPAVAGAVLFEGLGEMNRIQSAELLNYGLGFVFSFFAGILAIFLLLKVMKRNMLKGFGYYCFAAGGVAIVLHLIK
jgi:undecaprenyl-diphosphatase